MGEVRSNRREGIVALITVIIISLFLVSLGLLLGVEGNNSIFSSQLTNQARKAQTLAEAGIEDALIRLARNSSSSGTYTIGETNATTTITIASGSPVIINATSVVSVGPEQVMRTIEARVTLDADGQITNVIKENK